jgi:hypothetical protein
MSTHVFSMSTRCIQRVYTGRLKTFAVTAVPCTHANWWCAVQVSADVLANSTSVGMVPNVEDTPVATEAVKNVSGITLSGGGSFLLSFWPAERVVGMNHGTQQST